MEPIIGEVYWLQFYNDKCKTEPTDYLWLTKWGENGANRFSICTYHDEKYKDTWYSDRIATFTKSISEDRHNLYIPTIEELSWYKAMELLGATKNIPNIEKWYRTIPSNDILIFN